MSSRTDHLSDTQRKPMFLQKLAEVVEANMQNDQFGVEALAEQMNMSRSNLHRKLKQASGQTATQFIREHRLHRAMELLKQDDCPIAEVAYAVGFNSASYFTTCFTEYYGYPPGEARNKLLEIPLLNSSLDHQTGEKQHKTQRIGKIVIGGLLVLGLFISFFLYQQWINGSDGQDVINTPSDKSIAILPFRNLNLGEENLYLSEGVMNAISRDLSKMGDLKVISRTSTERYKASGQSAKQIAATLGVSNLLEGSIQRYDNTVRIEVQLIDARTEHQLWAENYDRELKDLLKIQSEIAEKVALALKTTLSPQEKAVLSQTMTDNAEAYDLYLKGVYEHQTYTTEGNHRSLKYFQRALALDSNFALAHAGMAISYIARAAIFGAELSALEGLSLAKPFLDQAIALDPTLVEARAFNAFYLLYHNWDFEGAEQEYRKAVVTNYPEALALYADFLNFTRRHEEALFLSRKLDKTAPYYPNSRMILSLYYAGHYDEATAFAESRAKMFTNYFTLDSYGFLMLNTGKYLKSIELFHQVMDIEGIRYPRMLGWMGAAYARSGQTETAQEIIDELEARLVITDAGSVRFFIAVIYTALNDKTSALHWLQAAYEQHEMEMPWLISEPQFYPLHEEPAFRELVDKVGFSNIDQE